ncbi:MAG TPA: hypothetical protein VM282_01240 [Acidimicrobiales bacterium]|nr:hypothetical protein [Acidimicrobiales bacterium]
MSGQPLLTPRRITNGIGLLSIAVGLFTIIDPADWFAAEGGPVLVGVVLAGVGVFIVIASSWLARHRPDDTPWDPLMEGDLHGGL